MPAPFTPARWVAGYPVILPDGTELAPGDVHPAIGFHEVQDSDNWEPAPASRKAKDEPVPGGDI